MVAGILLAVIMFTGAAVRLTESGLGCQDWPTCEDNQLVPEWGYHGAIEFGNRLISFVVSIAVGVVVVRARRIAEHPEFLRWALSLVAIVLVQIVLGGITVLVDLHPMFVGVHFLLSILSIWQAAMLWHRIMISGHHGRTLPPAPLRTRGLLIVGLAVVVLVLGTLVTGTGPHGGDSEAERLSLDLESIVRLHSISVWIMLAATVEFAARLRRGGHALGSVQRTLALILVQGGIGYVQYARGVPPLLVELHVIGSVAVWFAVVRQYLSLTETLPDWFRYESSTTSTSVAAPGS